jgi:hypothetical protein
VPGARQHVRFGAVAPASRALSIERFYSTIEVAPVRLEKLFVIGIEPELISRREAKWRSTLSHVTVLAVRGSFCRRCST